jgi:hypothetical protein
MRSEEFPHSTTETQLGAKISPLNMVENMIGCGRFGSEFDCPVHQSAKAGN